MQTFGVEYSVWVVTVHGPIKMGSEEILQYFSPKHMEMKIYFLVREIREMVVP